MKTVNICLGQDTAAYANFDLLVPDDVDGDSLNELLKEQSLAKIEAGTLVFDPDYDFSGARIVDAQVMETGEHVMEDEPLEKIPHDLGLAAELFLTGRSSYEALVAEAIRHGILASMDEAVPDPTTTPANNQPEG